MDGERLIKSAREDLARNSSSAGSGDSSGWIHNRSLKAHPAFNIGEAPMRFAMRKNRK
jgi:hypothetical protein